MPGPVANAARVCEARGRVLLEAAAYATGCWWLLYASYEVAVSASYHFTHMLEDGTWT
jgi:hypothetical protein